MAAALLLSAASQSFSLYDAVSAAVNASTSAADFSQPRNAGPNETFSTFRWQAQPYITYAVSPDFYAALRPLVAEALPFLPFPLLGPALDVDAQLRQAVRRAFDEWEANTPALRFVDVSDACAAERLWVPIDELRCIASPACALLHGGDSATPLWGGPSPVCRDPIQFNRTCSATDKNGILDPSLQTTVERDPTYAADVTMCASAACFDCERADIVVGAFVQANRLLGDHTGGRVLREGRSGQVPLGTNGRAQAGGSLTRARLELSADLKVEKCSGAYCADNCWRVDGDLCEWAGSHQVDGIDGIATALFGVLFALLLCGCCFAFLQLAQKLVSNLLQGWDLDQDGKVEIHEMMCVSFDSSFWAARNSAAQFLTPHLHHSPCRYVLDEFCGDLCFECRCPQLHQQKMSRTEGCLGVLETITSWNATLCAAATRRNSAQFLLGPQFF